MTRQALLLAQFRAGGGVPTRTSHYREVYLDQGKGKRRAQIWDETGKQLKLGRFRQPQVP